MKLFKKPGAIISEIEKLRLAEKFRREDRSTVSNFFNGAPPLTDEEAEALGFTVNVNHLFGYQELTDARDQVLSFYTKPANLIEVNLEAGPAGKRAEWGMKAALEASRVLRKVPAFKTAYTGAAGDATMHGEALFFFPNTTFPLPCHCPLSRMLIPDDSSTIASELLDFGIEKTLGLPDLHRHFKNPGKNWKPAALSRVMDGIYKDCFQDGRAIDATNVEEAEYRRQENSATSTRRRAGADTVYFYQQRCDKPGNPYDLTIMLRSEDMVREKDDNVKEGLVLYEGEAVIPRIQDCLHPFFMDCILGGESKWHRVLGLGPLNYQINHAVELLVNRAQQATMEGSMNLWQARDVATREAAQQILMKHNGVLPEGLNLLANRVAPNFSGILEMIQFFRQAGSKNAKGTTPNNGDTNDMLEVQFMAEQNQGASSSANRTANWYDYGDALYTESFRRLVNPYIQPEDAGYSEVMDFQNAMARAGIPLYWLQPGNVTVKCTRLVGNGVRAKELGIVQYLTTNRQQYAPEKQPLITRICTGLALDDYRLAEDLTPIDEGQDESPQKMRAESENAIMMTQRRPQAPRADDIDETHIMNHFPALEVLISDALQFNEGAFLPQTAQAFQVIGAHIVTHIQRVEGKAANVSKDPNREAAAQFMEQLNSLAAMAEKLLKQMEKNQEAGQQQKMDPAEMAKLELEIEKLKLNREKLDFAMQKFERTQGTREQSEAFKQMLALEKDVRDKRKTSADIQLRLRDSQRSDRDASRADVETAVKVVQAGKKDEKAPA